MPAIPASTQALIIDNGGSHIKIGLACLDDTLSAISTPLVIPNAIARPGKGASIPPGIIGTSKRPHGYLIGSEIHRMHNFSEMVLKRPIERGFISTWDLQADIWRAAFNDLDVLDKCEDLVAVVGEAMAAPVKAREAMDEMVFEEFGFKAYAAGPSERWAGGGCTGVILDCGFSRCTAVPVICGRELAFCARRLSLGGKALTNYLKETVSFRSWNMMDETVIINAVKERLCFVSLNYMSDLARCKRDKWFLGREYVLPDYSRELSDPLGHLKTAKVGNGSANGVDQEEQVLVMNNERICIPEALFNPGDIGMNQAGIADLVVQAVEASPVHLRPDLYANVLLSGGCCTLPNFEQRLFHEMRPSVPSQYDVITKKSARPDLATFYGAAHIISNRKDFLETMTVTKAEYEEHGSRLTLERFYKPIDK